tara:strand:- start:249 stop:842 length:594 start_codon:yes stop_codon:yes gene_type:complete
MAKLKNSQNFVDILSDVIRRKEISQENKRSAQWLRHQIRNFRRNLNVTFDDTSMTSEQLIEKSKLIRPRSINEAKLTLFQYRAKHAKKLPYYDRFPMSMIISKESDRFWGLNFHYLPYSHRARLLDAVRYGARINWNSLKKNKIVAPCIKQYLISHVQGTNGMTVEGTDQLKFVIFLPIENFNTSKQKVWKDSLGML